MRLFFTLLLFFGVNAGLFSQNYWNLVKEDNVTQNTSNANYLKLDLNAFDLAINNFQGLQARQSKIFIPNEKGQMEPFTLEPIAVLSPALAKRYPRIKTYSGWSTSRSNVKIRMSVTPIGVSAWLILPDGSDFFIQPVKEEKQFHYAYLKDKQGNTIPFECKTEHFPPAKNESSKTPSTSRAQSSNVLKTYRLAVATTGEYTNYWGDNNDNNGTNSDDALAAAVSTINRVNEVFETDFQVRLELVSGASLLYPDAGLDPFESNLNSELQSTLNNPTIFGADNYDVGHLFDYGSANGNAGCIGCVCNDSNKGSAYSSHPFVDSFGGVFQNDYFDIDFVAHELGHQFGAYHTFAFQTEGTGVNAEPGSGSTIMGYAGITGADDVQQHSDPNFHYFSIQNVRNIVDNNALCATEILITDSYPTVEAGDDYTIPKRTPYELVASLENGEGYDHTYSWEQLDSGPVGSSNFGPTISIGPQIRSVSPTKSRSRKIPNLTQVLSGELTQTNPSISSSWETLSEVGRNMNWGVTLRSLPETSNTQEGALVSQDRRIITIDNNAGPFVIQSQQTSETLWEGGSKQTIQWDVADTDIAPINTQTVSIYLSEDGGFTFPIELIANTPNDGEEQINVPNTIDTELARIKIKADNSIYFAINAAPFTLIKRAYIVEFNDDSIEVCGVDSFPFNFTLARYLNFEDTVELSLETVPEGLTATLSQSTFSSSDTNGTLNVSGIQALADGDYVLELKGLGGSFDYRYRVAIKKRDANVASPTLLSPQNNEEDVSTEITLNWETGANTDQVVLQVATDSEFTAPFVNLTTTKDNYLLTDLESDQLYYWRLAGKNFCLEPNELGAFSEVQQFRTSQISCVTNEATNLPKDLTDGSSTSTGRVQASINVRENLEILDINVRVDITHTWISDLVLTLVSPDGQQILLVQNRGQDNVDFSNTTFDQEASEGIASASYPYTGSYQPEETLENLYGTNSYGIWKLYVDDEYAEDTGTLNVFELEFCLKGVVLPNSDNDSFVDALDNCPTITNENQLDSDGNGVGDVCDVFSPNNITLRKRDTSCISKNNGLITVSAVAQFQYELSVQGDNGYSYQDSFNYFSGLTVNDVPSGNYLICITSEEEPNFERCFNTTIGEPDALSVLSTLNHNDQLLTLDLSGSDEYLVRLNGKEHQIKNTERVVFQLDEEWTSLEVSTPLSCQGVHTQWINLKNDSVIFPNPVLEDATLLFPKNSSGTIMIHNSQGELLWSSEVNSSLIATENVQLPMSQYVSGVYIITIQRDDLTETFKLIKQ